MNINKIDAEIPQQTEEQAMQSIAGLKGMFPFLLDLTPNERKRLAKLSRKRQDFIDKVLIHAEQNPGFFPGFASLEAYRRDALLIKCLQRLYAAALPFCEQLKDTIMFTQAEAYELARAFYSSVKSAASHGIDGTEQIIADLSYHFKRKAGAPSQEAADNPDTKGDQVS